MLNSLKVLLLVLVFWGLSQLSAQEAGCTLKFHPQLRVENGTSSALTVNQLYLVWEKQMYVLDHEDISLLPHQSVELVLPEMEVPEGIHILEVYAEGAVNLSDRLSASFLKSEVSRQVDLRDAASVYMGEPGEEEDKGCACLTLAQGKKPLASLWLYKIGDAELKARLLSSLDDGQNWTEVRLKSANFSDCEGEEGEDAPNLARVVEVESSADNEIFNPELEIFPNPALTTTTLRYELLEEGETHIQIFSVSGAVVYQDVISAQPAGSHELKLSVNDLSAGSYLIRLESGTQIFSKNLIVKQN
jgi:hypothetical protein